MRVVWPLAKSPSRLRADPLRQVLARAGRGEYQPPVENGQRRGSSSAPPDLRDLLRGVPALVVDLCGDDISVGEEGGNGASSEIGHREWQVDARLGKVSTQVTMRPSAVTRPTLREYLTVSQAAEFLGVSASTLRNWDRVGKVAARRHPVNGYRLYLQTDLLKLLKGVTRGSLLNHSGLRSGRKIMRAGI